MPRNQMLGFHRVNTRMYDLTGLRTGSVRDQFVRAISLIEGLFDDVKELSIAKPDIGVLILGAGVSGVACAMVAAQRGIAVTVIEKKPKEFTTLTDARFRRVAPYEYDWPRPAPQSLKMTFRSNFPLTFESKSAADLAIEWQTKLDQFVKTNSNLKILNGLNARNFNFVPTNGWVEAFGPWIKNQPSSTKTFGAVIACTGFMRERTWVRQKSGNYALVQFGTTRSIPLRSYKGYRFWLDSDSLDDRNFGISPFGPSVNSILISGGGDGAMQDLQRAATGLFGEKLYDRLNKYLCGECVTDRHLLEIVSAEDRARRACAWKMSNPNDASPDSEMQLWDDAFKKVVNEIIGSHIENYRIRHGLSRHVARERALKYLAENLLRQDFGYQDQPKITWVTKERHLGFAYALNRFLSLLLIEVMGGGFAEPHLELRLNSKITRIVRDDPAVDCCHYPDKCHGRTHHVELNKSGSLAPFQIIIIRHGLIFPKNPYLGAKAPVPEQLVPYEVPY
ncbi:hypothetical protein ABH945_003752 [Paraburkholderia sp. GAS333]|uniref:hypothetical protein n=1 Tax=Paraburkholderia sp. GAS333 TaxID=3156279 RepID=UPI003D1EAC66